MLQELDILLRNEVDPAYAKRAAFIFTSIEQVQPKKVLEVGCGRGFYLQALSYFSFLKEIHGIDLNKQYLAKAKKVCKDKRITLQKGSIYELPYPAGSFDFVLASEILEHLTDDAAALKEIKRVLKPGGTLVITVPNEQFPFLWDPLNWILMRVFNTHVNKNIWWLAGMWADHEKLYTKERLARTVRNQGFSIQDAQGFVHHCWPLSHFLLYGIGKNIVEKVGTGSFDRFNFSKTKGSFLATLFGFPSRFDSKKHTSYVDICLRAKK
jgi:2-polyprenyl-6-hydroxyphenyl methylase / 3-demethylubiquinone-9 3-methyltransferase